MGKLLCGDLTEKIISAAFTVHNSLGKNLTEHTYRNALIVKLRLMGLAAQAEQEVPIRFANTDVGIQRADVIVEAKIIVETKALQRIASDHLKKLLGTLRNTGYQLGLIINFGESVQVRRVINSNQNK